MRLNNSLDFITASAVRLIVRTVEMSSNMSVRCECVKKTERGVGELWAPTPVARKMLCVRNECGNEADAFKKAIYTLPKCSTNSRTKRPPI